MSQTDH